MTDYEQKLEELGLDEYSSDVYMSLDDNLVIQEWDGDSCVEHIFSENGDYIESYQLFD